MQAVIKDRRINAWKGESLSLQVVLWSSYDVKQVECEWSDFTTKEGNTIDKEIIQTRFVRYIMSDAAFVNEQSQNLTDRDSTLLPDMLDELPCMDMAEQTVRPLWITINVPHDADAGLYKTALKVYSKENPPQELRLELNIIDKHLPAPEAWRFQTNMCINPLAVAQWHDTPLWTKQHFDALQPYIDLMKRAGQKNITAYLFDHNNDTNTPLVQWVQKADGRISADFTNFDRWMNFLLNNGITSQIDCYAYEPDIDNSITFWNPTTNERVTRNLSMESDQNILKECYSTIINHLTQNGWFGKTVFVVNEGQTEEVSSLKELLFSINNQIKLELLAHEWTTGLLKDVYAANVPSQFSNLKEWFRIRHQQGYETSYELEASSSFPNIFLHSPSAEATWFGWYAAAQGIDGIHIEEFNNWNVHALTEARQKKRSSGSNYLVYPGARSSIRFERLIEGIQDFEKIMLIREQEQAIDTEESRQNLDLLDEVLSDFVIDRIPRESASQMIFDGQRLIYQLSAN